jgi:hypothetical protein
VWSTSQIAETITLITENRNAQVCITTKEGKPSFDQFFLVIHKSSSLGSVAKITKLDYYGSNPKEEIAKEERLVV